jgi:hypothetical protein
MVKKIKATKVVYEHDPLKGTSSRASKPVADQGK